MTIDGYNSCRKLGKQVLSTEFNKHYTNTRYLSLLLTVFVAEWLAYFPFDSSTRFRAALGVILFFKKVTGLKGHWNVPAIQSTE